VRLSKKILSNEHLRGFLCWLGSLYIRLVHATTTWTVIGGERPAQLWARDKPFILAFWHGRILMMPYCWRRNVPIHMLISQHRDGQIIAKTVSHFGIKTVAGSSSRGGAGALRAMLKSLKAGESVGITPDGPRGPRMRVSDGIISVARLSGVPVLPASYAIERHRVLGTWDRFVVALPFSKGVIIWGNSIRVPREADETEQEIARHDLEIMLNDITAEADRLCGVETIDPDWDADHESA